MPTSGTELRAERRAAEISLKALAARFGKARQTLWVLEKSGTVAPADVLRYRRALRDAIEASEAAETAAEEGAA